ncbi:MAG: glycosyltransferase [Gemmatimonadota bacterium]|nr:glycosyltransferase [Gemmatimonadota bacterium]
MTAEWVFVGVYTVFGAILFINVLYLRRVRRQLVPLPDDPPSVTIVVPARNEAANLARLLPSLFAQTYPRFDVVVYDDGSTDGTARVLRGCSDSRLQVLSGGVLPAGWVGKVHALYQATRAAAGDVLLFLDADTSLKDPEALSRLVRRHLALPPDSALTGIAHIRGGGHVLVSLVPFVIFTYLPLPLVARSRSARLSAMNGQCWMIDRALYRRLEPHRAHRAEVLEDVRIGRYLKAHGVIPHSLDLQNEVEVWMYRDLVGAWVGFRKNVYPFIGESVASFFLVHLTYVAAYLLAPLASLWFILAWYVLKTVSDRLVRMPFTVTAAAPLTLVLGALLQIDSAVAHWTGRATWKGRPVSRQAVERV